MRLSRYLEVRLTAALEPYELSREDFDVLNTLRRLGGSARPGVLAESLLISSGAMTARINRLERRGWITRTLGSQDRRAIQVALTSEGEDVARTSLNAVLAVDEAVLGPLDDAMRTSVADGLRCALLPLEAGDE